MAASEKRAGLNLHPTFYVINWILLSNVTILSNKWMMDNAGFRYPVILTWWHMTFATIATQILARCTKFLDGRYRVKMTWWLYIRAVFPIGLLYSLSTVTRTLICLYLSVPLIQMLKAASPFITVLVGWAWGVHHPTRSTFLKIFLVTVGVFMASIGRIQFCWPGLVYTLGDMFFESVQLIMVQHLVSGAGLNMDPLVSIYYYAPACAASNFAVSLLCGWAPVEWTHAGEAGFGLLLLSATIAFLLNVSSVLLVAKTSVLGLVLTGITKNILLVSAAVVIWGNTISPLQLIGYNVTLLGLLLYHSSWDELRAGFEAYLLRKNDDRLYKVLDPRQKVSFGRKPLLWVTSLAASLLMILIWTKGERPFGTSAPAIDTVAEAELLSNTRLAWLHVRDGKWWISMG
ncbi:TPT-domain-containing protein [Xylariomycetidae sp. FL0641]|nr:TPT-domain-containing protein [Xylariomycetidae sp. FL0641]